MPKDTHGIETQCYLEILEIQKKIQSQNRMNS